MLTLNHFSALPWQTGRNADMREVSLVVNEKKVLTFAAAYGFRNIQNITRQVKTGAAKYQYVEIMACPSGKFESTFQFQWQSNTDVNLSLNIESLRLFERRWPDSPC